MQSIPTNAYGDRTQFGHCLDVIFCGLSAKYTHDVYDSSAGNRDHAMKLLNMVIASCKLPHLVNKN